MFLTGLIFGFALVLSFLVMVVLTRPSSIERKIEARVAHLRERPQDELGDAEPGPIIKQLRLSNVDWLDALLQRSAMAQRIQLLIEQAESHWSVARVLAIALALGFAGFVAALFLLPGLLLAPVPALLMMASPFAVLRFRKMRRIKEFSRHLPEAIDLMSRALRAGHSITAAIEIVATESPEPVCGEFREVYRQQNFGLPTREALVQLAQRMPLPELGFVVTAMLLQRETGGNLVEILDRTTAVIRERLRIQGEIRIYTAQGRLTGWILSLLPIAMFFLLSMANRGYTRVLIEDPTGRRLVYAGLALMVVGGFAIRKIVDVKV